MQKHSIRHILYRSDEANFKLKCNIKNKCWIHQCLYNMCLWIFSAFSYQQASCNVLLCRCFSLTCFYCLAVWNCKACLTLLHISTLVVHSLCEYFCQCLTMHFWNLPSQCGFFKRSKQEDRIPRYHAVRIRKETPEYKDGKVKLDPFEKKQWMTTWVDDESYSWLMFCWNYSF